MVTGSNRSYQYLVMLVGYLTISAFVGLNPKAVASADDHRYFSRLDYRLVIATRSGHTDLAGPCPKRCWQILLTLSPDNCC